MRILLPFFILWVMATLAYGCSTLTEGWESVVDCSDAADISEVAAYMDDLSASYSVFHNKFQILKNPNITSLPDGLFGNIQFLTVEISDCNNLTYVGDFLGASSTTLGKFLFNYNRYESIPILNAPVLRELSVNSYYNPQVDRSTFANMKRLEVIGLSIAHLHPFAFYDLKYLRTLYVSFQPETFRNLTAGTLNFDSPSLTSVELHFAYFDNIEAGSIEGFPAWSRFALYSDANFKKEAFLGLLEGGALLETNFRGVCDCNVAWIRLGPYLPQTKILCIRTMPYPYLNSYLQDVPAEDFAHCEV